MNNSSHGNGGYQVPKGGGTRGKREEEEDEFEAPPFTGRSAASAVFDSQAQSIITTGSYFYLIYFLFLFCFNSF